MSFKWQNEADAVGQSADRRESMAAETQTSRHRCDKPGRYTQTTLPRLLKSVAVVQHRSNIKAIRGPTVDPGSAFAFTLKINWMIEHKCFFLS